MAVLNINRGNSTSNPYFVQLAGGIIQPARTVTAATDTATINDYLILDNAASNAITQKLPAGLSSLQTMVIVVKKTDSTANIVTVDGNGSTIDGASTLVLYSQNSSVTLQWNGAAWSIEGFNAGNWANWTPTVTAAGSMTVSALSITFAQFKRTFSNVLIQLRFSATLGGSPSNTVQPTLPIAAVGGTIQVLLVVADTVSASAAASIGFAAGGSSVGSCLLTGAPNWPLGAVTITLAGFYRIA